MPSESTSAPAACLAFTIPGPPVPKARARVANGHAFTPKATRVYEATVRAYAMRAAAIARWARAGEIAVTLRVYWPDARRRDLDNVCKAVTDAMNRIAYDDDSQIRELHLYGAIDRQAPRVDVEVSRTPSPVGTVLI